MGSQFDTVADDRHLRLRQLDEAGRYDLARRTALYIVSHMTDHFGRMPAATFLFDQLWIVKTMTWSVLAIEAALPLLLWIPRTRLLGVALGISLHLGIELTMHLFLFEWLMILGLVSFLGEPTWQQPAET